MRFCILLLAFTIPGHPEAPVSAQGTGKAQPPNQPVQTPQKGIPDAGNGKEADPKVQPPAELPLSIPEDAVRACHVNASTVSPADAPFTRWIWVQSGEEEDFKALSDALNRISRGSVIRRPIMAGGILARIDLRWYAPTLKDLGEWLDLWEQLQFDPDFSTIITADTLKLISQDQKASILIPQREIIWTKDSEGNWRDTGRRRMVNKPLIEIKDVVAVRTQPDHLRPVAGQLKLLQEYTGSICPVVSLHYFIGRSLSTIKARDGKKETLFSTIWGGLYYEFSGIRKSTDAKKATDLDQLIIDLGVGQLGTPFQKTFDKLRSDERVAVFRSKVTGKPRRVIWIGTPASRLSVAAGVVYITEDIRDEDVDSSTHPLMNLEKSDVKAYEVLWTRANGTQGTAIYGINQELLEKAAQEVVSDTTVPSPNSPVLQGGISCIRCHGPYDGWQPLENDAKTLLKGRYGVDILGDTTNLKATIPDTLDRLAGWYSGDPRKPLFRARDDNAEATLKATGPWKADGAQANTVKLSSARIARIYAEDRYQEVTPAIALRRMGFVPPAKVDAQLDMLRKLLPPVQQVVKLGFDVPPYQPEDVRIAALKEGIAINWFDYWLAESFMLARANQWRVRK